MRDDDRLLAMPDAEFGSGIVGACDVCGTRQAVVVLTKERFKLCVTDFLNKTWLDTKNPPGAPVPPYRSERIWFETSGATGGKAPAVLVAPTRAVRRPGVLVVPDVFGLTTTVLDAAIRFARDGFEVLLPDLGKTDGIGPAHHIELRGDARFRGGVSIRSKRTAALLDLYTDALAALRRRELVDPARIALFGTSYGASLALGLAAREAKLGAVVLAYPVRTVPNDLARLLTGPLLYLGGTADRTARHAREQLRAVRPDPALTEIVEIEGARHGFLSRDGRAYDVMSAEQGWRVIGEFLQRRLVPPPPRPPAPPTRTTPPPIGPVDPPRSAAAPASSPAPSLPAPASASPPTRSGSGQRA